MKNKILTFLFVLLVFGFTALDLLTPDRDFSEWENRALTQAPVVSASALFSGDLSADYESYITDQFALRDTLVKVKYLSDRALLKTDAGGIYISDNALFAKQNEPNSEYVKKNARAMDSFASKYPARFMLVPSSTYIYRDDLPPFARVTDEREFFDSLTFENLEFISLIDDFAGESDMYLNFPPESLYFRTDHHWTTDGALLGYNAYRRALAREALTRDDFLVTKVSDEFFGTSASKSGALGIDPDSLEKWERGEVVSLEVYNGKEIKEYPSLYFEEYLDKKDKYSYYLGQNEPLVRIKTNSEGGRILLFKDSYAHIFSQLLVGDYSEIVLVDLRYVKERVELLLKNKLSLSYSDFDEILFLYSFDTFTTENNMIWIK